MINTDAQIKTVKKPFIHQINCKVTFDELKSSLKLSLKKVFKRYEICNLINKTNTYTYKPKCFRSSPPVLP